MIQVIRCILLCFISTIIFGKSFAQQLDHISPSQNQHYFTQVSFINENEGWAFDEYDHSLYHTINGGKKWEEQYHFTFRIWSLKFTDENKGYISCEDSQYIFITKDGGNNWLATNLLQQLNFNENYARAFTVLDSMHFYILYSKIQDSLFYTNDGGNFWYKKKLPAQSFYNNTFFVLDTLHQWYISNKTIYRTVDGGNSWQSLVTLYTYIVNNGIYFSDSLNGILLHFNSWPGSINIISKTSNGGVTWTKTDTLADPLTIGSANFHFLNKNNGCLSINFNIYSSHQLFYAVYVTHDAGENWSENKRTDSPKAEYCVSTAGSHKYVRAGSLGLVDFSNDSGDTWQTDLKHNPLLNPTAVRFYNNKIGNAVSSINREKSEYFKTYDGGLTWNKTGELNNSVDFVLSTYIIGPEHYLTYNYDGVYPYFRLFRNAGMTNEIISLNGLKLCSFHINDANHIWMATDTAVYFSSDTCHTWQLISGMSGVLNHTANMFFLKDNKHGWLMDRYQTDKIYRTNDGGYSWTAFPVNNINFVSGIYFSDSLRGWLFGYDLYRTLDGGITWQNQYINYEGPEVMTSEMLFTDAKHGWLIGGYTIKPNCCDHQRQFVAYTNDSGQTWHTLLNKKIDHAFTYYSMPILNGIAATDSNHVWIYGQLYEMYKLHYEGESTFPDECHLEVFPNPSRVSFEIDLTCFGTEPKEVMIYDAVGKLVRQYQLQTETSFYEADAHLRDGIYLIHVKSASKSGTVKLIMSSIKKL